MKKVYYLFWTTLLFTSLLQSAFGQDKEITVSGKVTDSAGTAIPEAMVVMGTGLTNYADTAYTANDGNFTKKIMVNQNAYGIMYQISKTGFSSKTGYGIIDSTNTVDIGTVVLSSGISQKITVTGRVIDSTTGDPIEEALVRLSTTLWITDTLYDSVYTDKEGKFSHQMDAGNLTGQQPRLLYLVTKSGYLQKYGLQLIQGVSIDLGDIKLMKDPVSISPTISIKKSQGDGTCMAIYSMKGQLLYSGKKINLNTLIARGIVRTQPVIVSHQQNHEKMNSKKILLKE